MASDAVEVIVACGTDVVTARHKGREMAALIGFKGSDLTIIATAISEIARNIVSYANRGTVTISAISAGAKHGILVVAADAGPGIPDIAKAMQDGFSTGQSLGLGLPGAKRLMDEFNVESDVGVGTTVTMRKWLK